MFVGRKEELKFLENYYNSNNAEFVVLYGRRRIGKTETLNEFSKGKPTVFYSCREYTDQVQLKSFSDKMLANDIPAKKYINTFSNWNDAFEAIIELPTNEKKLLIIDEFPYMCKGNSSIPSVLQILWDEKLRHENVMIVLCGSSMSFIEKKLLSEKNPLYGRATGIYKMLPMNFYDAIKFFLDYSFEDKIMVFSILGGIPHYLKQFDPSVSLACNIKNKVLTKGTVLYSEVDFLLHQELRETSVYNSIVEAIALGNTSFNEIHNKTYIDKPKLSVYIKNLMELGIIKREFPPLTGIKEKVNINRGLYTIVDNFFSFWYAYGYHYLTELERGDAKGVYDAVIEKQLHSFASRAFEDICINYLFELNKENKLPFRISNASRWWGTMLEVQSDKKQNVACEIDIIANDSKKENFIIGECKFTNAKFNMGQLKKLKEKYRPKGNVYYYVFSYSGFSDDVTKLAKDNKEIFLIDINDIFSVL